MNAQRPADASITRSSQPGTSAPRAAYGGGAWLGSRFRMLSVLVAAVCVVGCERQQPLVAIVVDGPGQSDAADAARLVERQRMAAHGQISAGRVVTVRELGTLGLGSLAAAIGTADSALLSSLDRSGVPTITVDRPLRGSSSFCVCGRGAPETVAQRVALAMGAIDAALRDLGDYSGSPDRRGLTRALRARRPAALSDIGFGAPRDESIR